METVEMPSLKNAVVCSSIRLRGNWIADVVTQNNEKRMTINVRNVVIEDGRFVAYGKDDKVYSCAAENSEIEQDFYWRDTKL